MAVRIEPTKAHELSTEPEEPTVGGAKIGRSATRALQDQELLLQEDILSENGSGPASSGERPVWPADAPSLKSHFSWTSSLPSIGLRSKGSGSLLRGPLITNSSCTG